MGQSLWLANDGDMQCHQLCGKRLRVRTDYVVTAR